MPYESSLAPESIAFYQNDMLIKEVTAEAKLQPVITGAEKCASGGCSVWRYLSQLTFSSVCVHVLV